MSPQQLQWPPPYPPNTQGAAVSPDPDLGYPPYIETSPDRPEPLYYGSTAGDAAPLFYTPIQDASHAALLNLAYEMQLTGQALAPNQFLLPTAGYEYYGWAQGAAGSFVSTDNTTHNTEYRDIHQGGGFGLAAYNTVGPSRHMLGQHSPTHQGLDLGFDLAPESGPQVPHQGGQILPGLTVPDNGMMTGGSMASDDVAQTSPLGRPSPSLPSASVPKQQSPYGYLLPEEVIQCPICGRTIKGQAKSKKARLQRHMKTHDSNREKFSCQDCKLQFTRKDNLRLHERRKKHGNQRTE